MSVISFRSLCLSALLAFGPAAPAVFAQEPAPVTVKGAGGAPCREALRVYGPTGSQEDRGLYLQWVTGLSVGAALANQIVDVSPTGEIMDLVQVALLVCQEPEYEDSIWYKATSVAIGRLRPYWARSPERVNISHQGGSHWIYKDSVKQLQGDLGKLGYELKVDGSFGEQTGAAVAAVQEKINIANNPIPTGALFYGLTRPSR